MNETHIKKTFILQHDQSDCGVACLLSLIKYYGGNCSLERLREISGTSREGTTLLGLYQGASLLGFEAEGNEADIESLIAHGKPVILHLLIEDTLQHYVVCYGFTKGYFLVGDPAKGILKMHPKELDALWKSKTCLTLTCTERFELEKETSKLQKDWFLKLLKEDHRLLVMSIVLGVLIAVLGLAMAIFSQKLIDDILPSGNVSKLTFGLILLMILLMARIGISVLREYFLLRQSKDFNNRINSQFFTNLLYLPKYFFDTRKIGELVARLNDTQRIQRVIRQLAGSLVIDILVTVISIVFLFTYVWQVGIAVLFFIPLFFWIIYRSNESIIRSQKEVMQRYALTESNYITVMQGVSDIKVNNKQAIFTKINSVIFGNYQDRIFRLGMLNIRLSWQSGLAGVLFLVTLLGYTSWLVLKEELQVGELMAIITVSGALLPAVMSLALVAIPLNEAKIAFQRMYEFSSLASESEGNEELDRIHSLTYEDVSFRYPGRKEILCNINLRLEKGKTTAIVGESGSGKSTLVQLALRYYKPESGTLFVNGDRNINDIQLKSYRDLVGVVPQEITLFNGTVADNILLGETATTDALETFLQHFGFDAYFARFPQGLATILGEEGINISGGQKQLVALARALYKNPQLLILDEASSAMDRNTEQFVLSTIQRIKKTTAVLYVSHRLYGLSQFADEICILEEGTITHKGSHEELMKFSNFYSDFFK